MADLTISPASVGVNVANPTITVVQVGEAVTQGQPVYLKLSDQKYWKANATNSDLANVYGIPLTAGAADDFVVLIRGGNMDLGATLTVGETYVVSSTSGGIAPIGDLVATNYVSILGIATASDNLNLAINVSGIQKA